MALCSIKPTVLFLLYTHRGTLQCHTHNALLSLYSLWHSAVSNPRCFSYCILIVALCSVTPIMLCFLCTHRGTLQCHTHNALLPLYSPWHSAVSHPQCFAYCVLIVAFCSVTPTMLFLLCTHRGTLQCRTHNVLLPLYSPWHSVVSHPQCFAYCVLMVALCSVTPTMLCLMCTHRGTLQCRTHNALLTVYSPCTLQCRTHNALLTVYSSCTLQCRTHNALLTVYSPWHSAVSHPQYFACLSRR